MIQSHNLWGEQHTNIKRACAHPIHIEGGDHQDAAAQRAQRLFDDLRADGHIDASRADLRFGLTAHLNHHGTILVETSFEAPERGPLL